MASRKKPGKGGDVIDIREAMLDKHVSKLRELIAGSVQRLDEAVAELLPIYHSWQQANPDLAVHQGMKLEMVKYGFIGMMGFERCHERHRVPSLDLLGEAAIEDRFLYPDDPEVADEIMCPAMERGRCLPTWQTFSLAPCKLLHLEVYLGLGGGFLDDGVQFVLDDMRVPEKPEQYRKYHVAAARLVRKAEKREADYHELKRGPPPKKPKTPKKKKK